MLNSNEPQINYLLTTVQKVSVPAELPSEDPEDYTPSFLIDKFHRVDVSKAELLNYEGTKYNILYYASMLGILEAAKAFIQQRCTSYSNMLGYESAILSMYNSTSKAA